jgi:hypothetical protein
VRVHCDEGVASHIGPESCVGSREGVREALTGVRTGQPSSRERTHFRVPTRLKTRKATRRGALSQAPCRPGVVEDPGMYARSLYGNREISSSTPWALAGAVRIGKARSRSR